MKIYLLTIILFLNIISFSQINDKIKSIPELYSVINYHTTTRFPENIDLNKKGRQNWDFSELFISLNCEIKYVNPIETDYFSFFKTSNYCTIEKYYDRTNYIYKFIDQQNNIFELGSVLIIDSVTVLNTTKDKDYSINYSYSQDTNNIISTNFYSVHNNKVLQYEYTSKDFYKIINNSFGKIKLPSGKKYRVFLEKKFHLYDSIFIDNKFTYITDDSYQIYNWYTINRKGVLILVLSYYVDKTNDVRQVIFLNEENNVKLNKTRGFKVRDKHQKLK